MPAIYESIAIARNTDKAKRLQITRRLTTPHRQRFRIARPQDFYYTRHSEKLLGLYGKNIGRKCCVRGNMKEVIDVQTGQVKAGAGRVILRSIALGSCVAVIIVDPARQQAAMAHVMLPGKASPRVTADDRTKYAADAIDAAIEMMNNMGSQTADCCAAAVGGANVLRRPGDTIARDNVDFNLSFLHDKRLHVVARAVGGFERRNVCIDVEDGIITYAEGDGHFKELWRPE
ncbi:MAG: chemotaxis protein CheD [Phycisphaerae bacterium]|nr:chemotaxis protein CheD [Phycisphaerae bacterium]